MGSGSFGGGSGSFGGSSGGGGPGSSGSAGKASIHDRILALTRLTKSVNANPEIAKVRSTIYKLLQDRTRAAFLRVTLTDSMVVSAYRALLSLDADLRAGAPLSTAAYKLGTSRDAALGDLAEAIWRRGEIASTDERIEDIVRHAVTNILLRTVADSQDLYYRTPINKLGDQFNSTPLHNTADMFLGTIIYEAVRRALLNLDPQAQAVIEEASNEIAARWTDKFRDRSRRIGSSFRDMMHAIHAEYSAYSGGED